ncbi:MAG: alpha/beta hydrolase [Actinomycetota bacterium]|jgi:pimeloyl-ACP methyl ester carboxylesterase|uniref:alpha/beta fold hydrolase n=1 Tax=uncultured Ilumatobacter sp. TaxID=879968 RepID=UPI00374E2653|nr:alpha/beta hydrolase [Actinomycetota bacterium]
MASVQANGITIEYELTGEGDPLLLVMGLGGQLTDWPEGFPEQLAAQGFQVITFDNRDIGLSTEFDWEPPSQAKSVMGMLAKRPPKTGYLLSDMANDAAGLLDALGIESAHVVGMSMGGMIAQTLTIEHPQRVRSLTSIMSNPGDRKSGRIAPKVLSNIVRMKPPTKATAAEQSTKMFKLFSGPHYDPAEHTLRTQMSVERSFRPKGTARQTAAIMASPDRTAGLRGVTVPTLIVHGLMDKLVLPSGGVATARAVPDSRLLMFPDMGHDFPAPRHTEIIAAIKRNTELVSASQNA